MLLDVLVRLPAAISVRRSVEPSGTCANLDALPLLNFKGRGADVVQDAARAARLARLAYTAAMEDEEVREEGSLLFGHYSQEITLYLLGVALAR